MRSGAGDDETVSVGPGWVLRGALRCLRDPLAISRLVRWRAIAVHATLARGRMVDVGAGTQPYADLFRNQVTRIVAVEFPGTSPQAEVTIWGDAQALPLRAGCADVVLCVEVLEYLRDPRRTMQELARILRCGGHLLLTAPQIRGASNEPNDYWRFGHPGLRLLAHEAGFADVVITPCGGLCAAYGQRMSSWLYTVLAEQRGFPRPLTRALCGAVQVPLWLMDQLGIGQGETLHWMLTARKP